MKKKYYWKVVGIDGTEEMFSAMIYNGKYCVKYKMGETSKESIKDNGILVFNSRKNARKFKKSIGIWEKTVILKVENVGEKRKPIFYDIWDLRNDTKTELNREFPAGTEAFSKIKVLEKSR